MSVAACQEVKAPVESQRAPSHVSGVVYVDRNRSQGLDPGEGLEGVVVRFEEDKGIQRGVATTTSGGRYSLDLLPGTYKVDLPSAPDSIYHPAISGFTVSPNLPRILNLDPMVVKRIDDFVVSRETRVITTAAAEMVNVLPDGSTVVVPSAAGVLNDGDILVLGASPGHPNGLLRRITGIQNQQGSRHLSTTAVALEEAIVEGKFAFAQELDLSAGGNFQPGLAGAKPLPAIHTPEGLFIALDSTPVYDHDGNPNTTSDQIRLSGHIAITRFKPIIAEEIQAATTVKSRWGVEVEHELEIEIDWGTVSRSIQRERPVGIVHLQPFVIPAGIPVVITPQLELIIGAAGELHLGFRSSIGVTIGISGGFDFQEGKATPWGEVSRKITPRAFRISGGGSAAGYVRTPVVFLLYGIAGPYVGLKFAVDAVADISANPWWEVGFGVTSQAGFKPNALLARILSMPEIEVPIHAGLRFILADAGGPFLTPIGARIDDTGSTTRSVQQGQTGTVEYLITNTSGSSWTFGAGATLRQPNGAEIPLPLKAVSLAAGQSSTVSWLHTYNTVGTWDLRLSVWKESTTSLVTRLADTGWLEDYVTVSAVGTAGNATIAVQNHDGSVASAARVLRYTINGEFLDDRTTNSSGVATWSNIATGSFHFEAYSNDEYWGKIENVTVSANQTATRTLRRYEPLGSDFRVIRTDNNQTVTGGSVAQGTPMRLEVVVRNNSTSPRQIRIKDLRVDRNHSSPWDFEATSSTQTVSGNGSTTTLVFANFSTPAAGAFDRSFEVQTMVGGNWVKTDSWDWFAAVTTIAAPTTGNATITVQNQDGAAAAAAKVVRYTSSWQFIDERTTNSSGVATWTGIPAGSYHFEAYSNDEFWGNTENVSVTANQTVARTIKRYEPFASDFRVIRTDNNQNVTGASVPQGTPMRLEVVVRNNSTSSRQIRVKDLRVDRSRSSSWDYEATSAAQTVSGNGNTVTLSFTNFSTPVAGAYDRSFEVQTMVGGDWVKTDSWDWSAAVTTTAAPTTGNATITVQNQNGAAASGAKVVRYTSSWQFIDERTTNSSGVATWTGIPAGSYHFEAYSNDEFWGNTENVSVTASQTVARTIKRYEPFASDFRVIRTDNNQNVTGASVPQGTPMRLEIIVRNNSTSSRQIRVKDLRVDRSRSSSWDYEATSAAQTVSGNGNTVTLSFTNFSTPVAGAYDRSFEVQTMVGGDWVKTDSWDWSAAVTTTAAPTTGSATITVQNQDGAVAPGAKVQRYTSSWQFIDERTTNSSGVATWTSISAGSYHFEAYSNDEFWGNTENVSVTASQTATRTIRRYEPFASDFRIIRTDNNQVVTGGSVPRNTPLKIEIVVRNRGSSSRSVRIDDLLIDRSRSSSYDFSTTSSAQNVSANGATTTFTFTLPASITSATGTYYRVFETQTSMGGTWVKTDSWPVWAAAVTIL